MCELCGKPCRAPNWIISKGHHYHLGCMAAHYQELREALEAIDHAIAAGELKFAKERREDDDPYHRANVLITKALAKMQEAAH